MVDSTTVLLIVIAILNAVLFWSRRTYVYWQRRRIKFIQPTHLLGNLKQVLKLQNSFGLLLRDYYNEFAEEPLVGIYLFHQPALLIRDLNLVRTVLIEDFVSFSNRFAKCDPHQDKMGALSLFFVRNPEWREIRTKLSSVFTSGKLSQMFPLMAEIGCDLESYLSKLEEKFDRHSKSLTVPIKEICDLYNIDMIASIAFGLRTYSLRNKQTEIGAHSREMFILSFRRAFDYCVIFFLPKFIPFFRPKFFTPEHAEFLRRTIRQVIEERERSGNLRNDLVEMLLTLKKEADLNRDLSHFMHNHDFLAAQAAVFEIAGIETCSMTMVFALYELAKQPALQRRLHQEIQQTFESCASGGITHEKVMGMQYLNMVVEETLRMYPPVPFLQRECTPINKKRFYSFRPQVNCLARRGMPVFISNFAIHHDPKFWPNPEIFDPERFSAERKKSHTPMSYLPFGAGPHNCIGLSIAQLIVKLGLLHFLRDHRVEACDKTVDQIKFDPKYTLLAHEGGIYLKLVRCM